MNNPIRLGLLAWPVLIFGLRDGYAQHQPMPTNSKAVFQRFKDRYKGEDSIMDMSLVLINKRGERREIELVRWRRRKEGLVNMILCYVSPRDVKGTTTLTVEQKEGDDLQRLYLPALKKHRRIATSDKGKSWLGTDLAYEEVQEKKPDDFNYTPMQEARFRTYACWTFSMIPKTPDRSSYGRLEYWFRKDNGEMVRGRYYNKRGRCLKEMRMGEFVVTPDKEHGKVINSATWMSMLNFEDNHRTLLITRRARYNNGFSDRIFTPSYIERPRTRFEGGHRYNVRIEDCLFDSKP